MAISIEQEKKKVKWLNIIGAIIIVGAIFIGSYFLFFRKPELIEVVVPGQFQDLSKLSQVKFNPQELLSSPKFKILRQFQVKTQPETPGRSNPFQPF